MTNTRGFTLVEILVAISLSGIIITALLSVFFSFIEYQASTQEERDALESVRFMLTDITRELSFGGRYVCDSTNFPVTEEDGDTVAGQCRCIAFTDQLNRTVKVRYNDIAGRVEKSVEVLDRNPNVCAAVGLSGDRNTWAPLTDSSIDIRDLRFEIGTETNRQPRVKIFTEAGYTIDGEEETVTMKTQVTRRIIEPGGAVLKNLRIGVDVSEAIQRSYFVYAPCPAGSTTPPCDQRPKPSSVCQDENGNVFDGSALCDIAHRPVAVEFTTEGLYVLVDSGLIFFIPNAVLDGSDGALRATGKIVTEAGTVTTEAKYVTAKSINNTVQRVVGKGTSGGCRRCNNDPHSIISLHPRQGNISALGNDGSLYIVPPPPNADNDPWFAERLLSGSLSSGSARYVDTDSGTNRGKKTLSLFTKSDGTAVLRLFQGAVGTAQVTGSCTDFNYVPLNLGTTCRQLWPDPDTPHIPNISPSEINDTFSGPNSIPLSFIDRLQVINETVHLWYADNTGKHLLSIGQSAVKKKRNDSGNKSGLDYLLVTGKKLAHYNGVSGYTFICDGDGALCAIDSINDTTFNTARNKIALSSDIGKIEDHLHFKNYPVGVSNKGRLLYFTGINTAVNDVHEAPVYNNPLPTSSETRILCNVEAYNHSNSNAQPQDYDQQVSFEYISEKHPTKDMVALIGKVFDVNTSGAVHEIYLLQPTARGSRKQFVENELEELCNTEHVERFHLPNGNGGPALDIVRLTGVRFVDAKDIANEDEPVPCNASYLGNCTLLATGHNQSATRSCTSGSGSCSGTCSNGAWTGISNSCTSSCDGRTTNNCDLDGTDHGLSDGNCTAGYTGNCSYICSNAQWQESSNTCTAVPVTPDPESCDAGTVGICTFSSEGNHGDSGVSGSCTAGYTGSCTGSCSDGSWSVTGNTCTAVPVTPDPESCDAGTVGTCTFSSEGNHGDSGVSGSCTAGYTGSCTGSCSDGSWSVTSNTCITEPTSCNTNPLSNCTLLATGHNQSATRSCTSGSGSCSGTCSNGAWTGISNSCTSSCDGRTTNNCDLDGTDHGLSDGNCTAGYTGNCSYICSNAQWQESSNTCEQNDLSSGCSIPLGTLVAGTPAEETRTLNSDCTTVFPPQQQPAKFFTFTLASAATVTIVITESTPNTNYYIDLWNQATFDAGGVYLYLREVAGLPPVTLTWQLPAGDYLFEIAHTPVGLIRSSTLNLSVTVSE